VGSIKGKTCGSRDEGHPGLVNQVRLRRFQGGQLTSVIAPRPKAAAVSTNPSGLSIRLLIVGALR